MTKTQYDLKFGDLTSLKIAIKVNEWKVVSGHHCDCEHCTENKDDVMQCPNCNREYTEEDLAKENKKIIFIECDASRCPGCKKMIDATGTFQKRIDAYKGKMKKTKKDKQRIVLTKTFAKPYLLLDSKNKSDENAFMKIMKREMVFQLAEYMLDSKRMMKHIKHETHCDQDRFTLDFTVNFSNNKKNNDNL